MKDFSNDFFDDLPDYIPVQEAFQNVVNIPFNVKIIVQKDVEDWLMDMGYAKKDGVLWEYGDNCDGEIVIKKAEWFDYRMSGGSTCKQTELFLTADGFAKLLNYIMDYTKYDE